MEAGHADEVQEKREGVAAFFDLDGTLMALPSLERRFFRMLRYRQEIPTRNYFSWLREALRLARSGVRASLQENKMYLRGLQESEERGGGHEELSPPHKGGHRAQGQASTSLRCNPRLPVPVFFEEAIERVAWHGQQRHVIVLVSGTLEPLAKAAARALEAELAVRGVLVSIRTCATQLEEMDGRWTGKILGDAVFGEAKARAAFGIAAELKLDLAACYAYGDSANDRWLLGTVGRPVAVNPVGELEWLARMRAWPIVSWKREIIETQRRADPVGTGAELREENGNMEAVIRTQAVNSEMKAGTS
jgi:HAD superfamily hydrolase (TIGR01490 family)